MEKSIFKARVEFANLEEAVETMAYLKEKGIKFEWLGPKLSPDAPAIIAGHKKGSTGKLIMEKPEEK